MLVVLTSVVVENVVLTVTDDLFIVLDPADLADVVAIVEEGELHLHGNQERALMEFSS